MELVLITGMSGSGKSQAVDVLEDIGFYCVDNVPAFLLPTFVNLLMDSQNKHDRIAIVTDIRSGDMYDDLVRAIQKLREDSIPFHMLYLEASDDVLAHRFKETRRRHPLLDETGGLLPAAIRKERSVIGHLREIADYTVDSSDTSAIQLRERIRNLFLEDKRDGMSILCMSYGAKHGGVSYADLVFDVKCLPNPFYINELRDKTGLDKEVRDYVMSSEEAQCFRDKLFDMIDYLIPLYIREGKSQLVIAFGCTGGHHRSVTFACEMYDHLKNRGYNVSVNHRDIKK
jgi:UPF0042 nucleotide-binding protein